MRFWKKHLHLRRMLMGIFFLVGLYLVLAGWRLTGQLVGLGMMLAGILLMLFSLWLYNKAYQ